MGDSFRAALPPSILEHANPAPLGSWRGKPRAGARRSCTCPLPPAHGLRRSGALSCTGAVTVAFITHPECLLHEMGEGHPERPERLGAIEDKLIATRLEFLVSRAEAPQATREQLLRVHDVAYLNTLERIAPRSGLVQIDPDTAMNPHTLPAALRAAGAAVLATDLGMAGP